VSTNTTSKKTPAIGEDNAIRQAFNVEDKSLTVNGFLVGKVGHKIVRNIISPTVDEYSFYDEEILLYTIKVTYNNSNHDDVNEAERIN